MPASDGGRFDVLDPATGDVIATVADGTVEDAIAAVDAADGRRAGWAATAPRQRAEVLRRAFELMTAQADELAHLIIAGERQGARPTPAARWPTPPSSSAGTPRRPSAPPGEVTTAPSGANRILVLHQPVGIAVLVTPWNFPAAMATRKIGPALAAGCTVVLKPAVGHPAHRAR